MKQSTENNNTATISVEGPMNNNSHNGPDLPEGDDSNNNHGHASMAQTIVNMAKTCAGTGCLALPFAASQGGILLHCFGLLVVGVWNVITVQRLCQCYNLVMEEGDDGPSTESVVTDNQLVQQDDERSSLLIQQSTSNSGMEKDLMQSYHSTTQSKSLDDEDNDDAIARDFSLRRTTQNNSLRMEDPPKGTTTLVKLAWFALGRVGANSLDVIMVAYLLGVILTYVNAMRSFLEDTCFTTGLGFVDSFLLVAIMGPLSVVPHTGHLAQASAMGLLVLAATFLVIAWYGFVVDPDSPSGSSSLEEEQQDHWQVLTEDNLSATNAKGASSFQPTSSMQLFPQNGLAGASQWFGCVVFGFGIAPLTFSFREAMKEPHRVVPATWMAMIIVSLSYIVIGVGLLYPFPDIEGDVLHELPTAGWLPTVTRLAMLVVVLVTAPLLIVPCGELLEGKLVGTSFHQKTNNNSGYDQATQEKHSWRLKALVRWSLCLLCAAISSFVPGFVNVLSFVGCCCVAVVGFCLPPFLHIILRIKKNAIHQQTDGTRIRFLLGQLMAPSLWADVALLAWGLLATAISTYYTFQEVSSS